MGDDRDDEASRGDEVGEDATETPDGGDGTGDHPFAHLLASGDEQGGDLEAARGGDQHAFRALWDGVKRPARAICVAVTDTWADAEDALQETQIAVWRHLDRCRDEASFRAWVCAIARNAAYDVQRRRARGPKPTDGPDEPDPAEPAVDSFADGLVGLLDVLRATRRLPENHRDALLLWASDVGYPEIAATLDARPATVKQWVHRARQQLRKELGGGL